MHQLKAFLIICFLLGSISAFCCGNEYSRTEPPFYRKKLQLKPLIQEMKSTNPYWFNGYDYRAERRHDSLLKKVLQAAGIFSLGRQKLALDEIQVIIKKNIDYKLLSDFAWNELKQKHNDNAVALLEYLYEKHPGEYNIVANLGTAYEVTGKNEKALEFIKKAVAINPQSHYGSEWIHIKILEQKVNPTPDYSLILDLGADKDYYRWLSGSMYNKTIPVDSMMVQIAYQLHERISFINKPDPIIAQLVLDFADLVPLAYSRGESVMFYNYAASYDPALKSIVKERVEIVTPPSIPPPPPYKKPKR